MDRNYHTAVPFRDIDMHGHMHNAAHVSHFEAAISHFIRFEKLTEHFSPGGSQVFHVRKVAVEFHNPTHYDDLIYIECRVGHLGRSSLGFAPRMFGPQGELRATANIVWVCVDRQSEVPCSLPNDLREKLDHYPDQG